MLAIADHELHTVVGTTKFKGSLQLQYFRTSEWETVLISEQKWLVCSHTTRRSQHRPNTI